MNGLGNPHDATGYYDQFRGGKVQHRDEVLHRPLVEPEFVRTDPFFAKLHELLEFHKFQWRLQLDDWIRTAVFFSKRPAFLEPPFFSNPVPKLVRATLPVSGTFSTVFEFPVPARSAVILTAIGMDYDSLVAVDNNSILWKIQFNGELVPWIDDNSGTPGTESAGIWSFPIGTFSKPLCLSSCGLGLRLRSRGNTELMLLARNTGAGGVGAVTVRVFLGFYWYPMDMAGEHEFGDYMR